MELCQPKRSAPNPESPKPASPPLRRWPTWIGITALTLITTWPGIQQGLGRLPEEVTRVAISSQITSSGDLNPHWFGHPATLLIYLLAGFYKLITWHQGIPDVRDLYLTDPSSLFLTGRIVARLAAAASGILTFEVARTLLPFRWALSSALLLAINPLFTMHAHRARADHLLTITLLVGTWLLLQLQAAPSRRKAALLAGFTGVAVTYKYSAISLMMSWLLSLWAREGTNWRTGVRCLQLVVIATCSAFIASPFLLLSWHEAWGGLGSEIIKDSTWEPHQNAFYLIRVLQFSFSTVGVMVLAIATFRGLDHCRKAGLKGVRSMLANAEGDPISALVLVYGLYILSTFMASTYNATWIAPVTPFLSIILALQLYTLDQWITRRWRGKSGLLAVVAIIALVASHQLIKLHAISAMRQLPGTTATAEAWLRLHIRPGDSVLLLQPSDAQEPAHFPRIQVAGVKTFISEPNGMVSQVCRGEGGNHFTTRTSLPNEPCYPRPIFRSTSNQTLEQLAKSFDYVIYADRLNLPTSIKDAEMANVRFQIFTPPQNKAMLGYSSNPFPQGDAGAWSSIQIADLKALNPSQPKLQP